MSAPADPSPISLDAIVAASRDQVSSDLDGEMVVLSMQDARYYGFDGVAARIWELVRAPIRVAELRDTILAEYDVPAARCEADLLAFLGEIAAKGLLEVRTGG
jgi:hypothetical protein